MSTVSLVAAMAENGMIGKDGVLPWHLPADLKHFKAVTLGKPVIMGRRTWQEVGKPLPGRRNIVISRQADYAVPGAELVASLDEALALVADEAEVMVIGGGQIYREAIPRADVFYRTLVCGEPDGDTRFPEVDWSHWELKEERRMEPDERHAWPLLFQRFERAA